MNLDPIVQLSRNFGSNPDYVLAGGGNTSQKEGDFIAIKASGVQLGLTTRPAECVVSFQANCFI
jgi:rhamnose utilization protein RhaD (predicted bifunctional aldolase and dehydrogenase)